METSLDVQTLINRIRLDLSSLEALLSNRQLEFERKVVSETGISDSALIEKAKSFLASGKIANKKQIGFVSGVVKFYDTNGNTMSEMQRKALLATIISWQGGTY